MSPSNAPVGRAWADIDLAALVANARKVQAVSGVRLLPMVKADGYGTGAIAVARALETLNPWGYGVATVQEGIELRSAGIRRPILVCSPLQLDWIDACLAHGLRPAIGHTAALDAWLGKGSEPFHLEFDTGMGRAGFRWDDVSSIRRVAEVLGGGAEGCEGVFTHFCSGHDASASRVQWHRFQEMLASLPRRPGLVHAANSAAALRGSVPVECAATRLVIVSETFGQTTLLRPVTRSKSGCHKDECTGASVAVAVEKYSV